MARINEFTNVRYAGYITDDPKEGEVIISHRFRTLAHLCPCGCGNVIHIPFSTPKDAPDPNRWLLTEDEGTITLSPSLLNLSCPNRAHYFVEDNQIKWV